MTVGGQLSRAGSVEFWSNITVQGNYDITGNTFFASYTCIFDNDASIVNLNHGQELKIPGHVEFNTGDAISIDSILLTGDIKLRLLHDSEPAGSGHPNSPSLSFFYSVYFLKMSH